MAKRKRVGYGSFDWADHRNSKIWLQNEFLETIAKLEPKKEKKPLGDLSKQPFEEYVSYREKQDRKSISRRQQVYERGEERADRESLFNLFDEDDPLRRSIWQWGETYHLNSDWCYDAALKTLLIMYEYKETTARRFASIPFYGHPRYLGFGSLLMVYNLASMPRNSLTEEQKALVDTFSKEDKEFIESFNERQRAFLSYYPYDPHGTDDEFFWEQTTRLIKAGLDSPGLPVFNLLSRAELDELHNTLLKRAKELWERLKEVAKRDSVIPIEVGDDEVNKHVEWAVRYQVFEEKYYSIEGYRFENRRDKYRVSANVRKQVLKTLSRIDLRPRPPRV